jgi:hypothetical protein
VIITLNPFQGDQIGSPNGWLFQLGSFFNYKSSPKISGYFFLNTDYV